MRDSGGRQAPGPSVPVQRVHPPQQLLQRCCCCHCRCRCAGFAMRMRTPASTLSWILSSIANNSSLNSVSCVQEVGSMCCASCCKLLQRLETYALACAWQASDMIDACCRASKVQRVLRQGDPQPHPRELPVCPPHALPLHLLRLAVQVPLTRHTQRSGWATGLTRVRNARHVTLYTCTSSHFLHLPLCRRRMAHPRSWMQSGRCCVRRWPRRTTSSSCCSAKARSVQ